MMTEVIERPKPRSTLRKSAAVSPTVVASTLITQKMRVTSGTLVRMCRTGETVEESVEVVDKCSSLDRVGSTSEQGGV